jgi:hypothetical protein
MSIRQHTNKQKANWGLVGIEEFWRNFWAMMDTSFAAAWQVSALEEEGLTAVMLCHFGFGYATA